jgi:hypothetical protein
MHSVSIRLLVAVATFVIGVAAASLWIFSHWQSAKVEPPAKISAATLIPYNPCSFSRTENQKISASEAVQLAECFVIQNGYTDLPPMEDTSNLAYETFDDAPPAERALEMRRNTLERRAYGVWDEGREKGGRWVKGGWTVAFRYNPNIEGRVRVVTMDEYGNHMRMQHPDYPLGMFKKPEEYTR